jgi:glycosyltransferase involved in cell wall biosynthesis
MKHLFISWSPFSRRIASMDAYFAFETHYIPPPTPRRWLKPFGYAWQAARTLRLIWSRRPDTVWLHCPPSFLPHLALLARALGRPFGRGGFRIVADCHHGTFAAPWDRVPGLIAAINRCDVVLVHNAESYPLARGLGVDAARMLLLEDPPSMLAPEAASGPAGTPYVLAPCSFSDDEPIPVLIAAARLMPEVPILVTGSRRKAKALGFTRDCPENLRFTGYLELAEFERLLRGAAVVLGLTSVEGIQLSVANEAIGADRALVLSDTAILRSMFGAAALFARNTPEELSARLREGLARRRELEARSRALKARRLADWRAPAEAVARLLAAPAAA